MSSTYRSIVHLCLFVMMFLAVSITSAHDPRVHERMSLKAAQASQGLNYFLDDIFGSGQDPAFTSTSVASKANPKARTASQWIMYGSHREDDTDFLFVFKTAVYDEPSGKRDYWYACRCQHHFWDPITNKELTDGINSVEWRPDPLPSFSWISDDNPEKQNSFSWPKARQYQEISRR